MPRISFRDYTAGNRPWWEYVGDAGQAIAAGVNAKHREGLELEQQAANRALAERRLDDEVERTKLATLQEVNRSRILGLKADKDEADRQAAVQGLQELAGEKRQDAVRKGIDAAIASPQGALGPFGLMTRTAEGAASGIAKVDAEMGPKIEFAKTLSKDGAKWYLGQQAAQRKQEIISDGYQKDTEAVLKGVTDGVIDAATGQKMVDAIQSGLRSGAPPGKVHAQVAKAYDLHAKVQKRLAGWEESDRKAGELMAMLEKMAQTATIPSTGQKISAMLAKAKGEWGRTQYESFRKENDGEKSLRGLEAILFGAQVENEEPPTGIQYSEPPPPMPNREQVIEGAGNVNQRGTDTMGEKRPQPEKSQGVAQAGPSQGPERAQAQPTEVKPAQKMEFKKKVDQHVAANGRAAITQGADSKEEVKALFRSTAKALGLSPTDPYVIGAVTDALVRLKSGALPFTAPPAKPVRESMVHPAFSHV